MKCFEASGSCAVASRAEDARTESPMNVLVVGAIFRVSRVVAWFGRYGSLDEAGKVAVDVLEKVDTTTLYLDDAGKKRTGKRDRKRKTSFKPTQGR